MTRLRTILLVAPALAGVACIPPADNLGEGLSSSSSSEGLTTAGDTSSGVDPGATGILSSTGEVTIPDPLPTSGSDSGGDSGSDSGSETGSPEPTLCDAFAQNCPPGFKCSFVSFGGGSNWDSSVCVPVADQPVGIGEPCTIEDHLWSGQDDCDADSVCFSLDAITLQGHCVAFCVGSEVAPTCADADSVCIIPGSLIPSICLPQCDPVAQDCPAGQGCHPLDDTFVCTPYDVNNSAMAGDPCGSPFGCVPGTTCADGDRTPGCAANDICCVSLCELDDPTPPCAVGQVCEPLSEPSMEFPNVGTCGVP